jgi:hypothetical protein
METSEYAYCLKRGRKGKFLGKRFRTLDPIFLPHKEDQCAETFPLPPSLENALNETTPIPS